MQRAPRQDTVFFLCLRPWNLESTGLPISMFYDKKYSMRRRAPHRLIKLTTGTHTARERNEIRNMGVIYPFLVYLLTRICCFKQRQKIAAAFDHKQWRPPLPWLSLSLLSSSLERPELHEKRRSSILVGVRIPTTAPAHLSIGIIPMEQIAVLRDTLEGHTDMVTGIAVSVHYSPIVVSSSRDKSVLVWKIKDDGTVVPHRRLTGHSHFVEDVVLNSDGQLAFSASWDGDVRLWDIATGSMTSRFAGHTKDALSVTVSPDNRQIVSGGRDRTIKVWNSLGECKCTIAGADAHTEWVSCVRFSPRFHKPVLVSGSWDRTVKVWNFINRTLMYTLVGHTGYVNAVAVTPDGTICASGGQDTRVLLWELAVGAKVHEFNVGSIIHAICFSPHRYWLCVASENDIRIWDLDDKILLQVLKPEAAGGRKKVLHCFLICLRFSKI
ncbi:hypothetical protein GW17_00028870 [Ensete ventricosum]|nr:hypothetical protein GW17_00028870 [Ensete ventricosum]